MSDQQETPAPADSPNPMSDTQPPVPEAKLDDVDIATQPSTDMARVVARNVRPNWRVHYVHQDPTQALQPEYALSHHPDIKLAICITAYNETYLQLLKTLTAVQANIDNGEEFSGLTWREILVVIVLDGRTKSHPSLFTEGPTQANTFFTPDDNVAMERKERAEEAGGGHGAGMGAGAGAGRHHDDPVAAQRKAAAHVFEETIRLNKSTQEAYHRNMQCMWVFKAKNGGKIDSHLWFLNAICKRVKPSYITLLDAGTNPDPKALLRLVKDMDDNRQIAGCCGQILVGNTDGDAPGCKDYLNLVVASQMYEYLAGNFLDKALESSTGFVSVLPGAFSSYRYAALADDDSGARFPLQAYFALAWTPEAELNNVSPLMANMYLAEDRVLCFELLSREGCNYTLHYNSLATALTDPPQTLGRLVAQRRRWLNGSYFATLYVLKNVMRLFKSRHSAARKLVLSLLFLYQALQVFLQMTLLGNTFLVFDLSLNSAVGDSNAGRVAAFALTTLYLVTTACVMVFSLANSAKSSNAVFSVCAGVYGALTILTLAVAVASAGGLSSGMLAISLVAFFGIYIAATLHGVVHKMAATTLQFLLLLPTYLNLVPIYSFCNIHDVSWGTRDSNPEAKAFEALRAESFRFFRSMFFLAFLLINVVYVSAILEFEVEREYALAFVGVVSFFLGVRIFGSVLYQVLRLGKSVFPTKFRQKTPARQPTAAPAIGV